MMAVTSRLLTWHARRRFLRLEPLEPRWVLATGLVITEFMASNDTTLLDGDGFYSDWIEIHNPTDQTIDLAGWHLTDNDGDLNQWTFPSAPVVPQDVLDLTPGEYLVVFASGQATGDTIDAAGNLHTNFKLTSDGEYLALVQPDGMTIEHAYAPMYPAQLADISYGIVQESDATMLIGPNAMASYAVPLDGTFDSVWKAAEYDDNTWTTGSSALGFGSNASDLELYLPFDETSGLVAADLSGNGNDGTVYDAAWINDPTRGQVLNFDSNSDYVLANLPGLNSEFTIAFWARQTSYSDNNEGLFQVQDGGTSPGSLKVIGGWVNSTSGYPWGRLIELDGSQRNLPQTGPSISLNTWTHFAYRGNGSTYQLFINGTPGPLVSYDGTILLNDRIFIGKQGTESWRGQIDDFAVWSGSLNNSDIAALASGILSPEAYAGFGNIVQTDLTGPMRNQGASSAYLRFHFSLTGTDFDEMTLRIRYDDGFAAYLNGTQIAFCNAPTNPVWNDTALAERSNLLALQFEEIDVRSFVHRLTPGDNVLAVHGLNLSGSDSDFLIDVELIATNALEDETRYMIEPTPGEPNAQGYLGFLGDTQFDTDRGFFSDPFDVTITSTDPIADIYYTTDGSEPSPTNPTATLYSGPVPITTTTMLRAGAFQEDYLPTNIDTQTYIFLEDVLRQDPLDDPSAPDYPTVWQAGASADYEMDPEVVNHWDDTNPANTDIGIREALRSIPTMSIVMDHDDLWNASNGIYPNATNYGTSWIRPGSIEYFDPNTGEAFQYNAGIQMHGHASRDNVRLKKHSFRLIFNDDYNGPTELPYQLFKDSELDEINTIVLRACFTDSFATRTITGRYSPLDSTYTRDVWMRDTQLAMGHFSSHSTYVHLYINGLYWGLYNPAERPDDAFMEAYFGGAREDWDIIKDFNELFRGDKTAWNAMFALADQLPSAADPDAVYWQLQGKNPDGTPNPVLPNYLDMNNLIDFMILHFYAGAEDWPHHNWYAARNRVDPGNGFMFFVWDQEIVLDGRFRDRTSVDDDYSPAELYDNLRYSPELLLHFADRVQLHMYGNGALTTEANQTRWMARADEVEAAIIGESARWGDAREGEVVTIDSGEPSVTIPTMTVDHWRASRDEVIGYFEPCHQLAMQRFRTAGLYPAVDAPSFSQHGGSVPSGFQLGIVNHESTGTV
ncbi:MAG: lamin tail domain-containing protein, partial [Pirellulales bacterium]|nr:lamin tail domain-containing protein [Pirellulales bacterium]